MQPFARPLGDAAKKARAAINLTQRQVAGRIGADARSVLNIENYKGNPKMQILFPPVRELQIDAREVFHPKMGRKHHAIRHQCFAVEACCKCQRKSEPGAHEKVSHKRPQKVSQNAHE